MSKDSVDVIVPPLLEGMVQKMMGDLTIPPRHATHMAYVGGWIKGRAGDEYKELIKRDGIPEDPRIVKLLCELALMRALVRWHEVKNQPPPMPSISSLES